MKKLDKKLFHLNDMARELMRHADVMPKQELDTSQNYLATCADNDCCKALPKSILKALNDYNQTAVDVSNPVKINLLIKLVTDLHRHKIYDTVLIDALQKEIRRNYALSYDLQFKYNYSFQLKMLAALSAMSTGAKNMGEEIVALFIIALTALEALYAAIIDGAASTNQPRVATNTASDSEKQSRQYGI